MSIFSPQLTALFVPLVLALSCAAQEAVPAKEKIFQPKLIAGLADIVIPTPSKTLEPIPPNALVTANNRFQLGIQHMEKKNYSEAIVVFKELVEDFPSLREPYTNLAILYARQNQFDKSRAALELMLRVHPNYRNGYETLGDVYAQMAKESYNKAFLFGDANSSVGEKIYQIRSLRGKDIGEE